MAERDEAVCFQSRVIMYLWLDIVETVLNITWVHPAQSHMLVYTVKLTQTHQQKERKTDCHISTAGCELLFISFKSNIETFPLNN